MLKGLQWTGTALLGVALLAPLATVGCGQHHAVRVYDPYYSDYHNWDDHERVYYNQWIVETHRENRDYNRLPPDEQKQYWDWRHSHGDHDHDHDHH